MAAGLAVRPSVRFAVTDDYEARLEAFLRARNLFLSKLMDSQAKNPLPVGCSCVKVSSNCAKLPS
jgi:hypothetical protein